MPEETLVVLEPDVDDCCYLFAQGIMRLLEEEDAAHRKKQKQSQDSEDQSTTASRIQGADSEETPIDH